MANLLEPGFNLTLRPMQYPKFYEYFINSQKNTWTVDEISFGTDIADIREKLSPAERHVVNRLVAFFATGDTIVANNAVLSLYKHVNSPEARLYYGRQIFEESLHVQFYLTLLDNYLPDETERFKAFDAVNNIPSIKNKADFCAKWMEQMDDIEATSTDAERQTFLQNLIAFAACVEGLFFMASFSYVYFLRSKGLLNGLADGTNWVFRDETMHMNFGFEVIDKIKEQYPQLWTRDFQERIYEMIQEAIDCEMQFAKDALELGVAGLTAANMKEFLEYCADGRLRRLGLEPVYQAKNPFGFMDLQDLDGHSNFFERTVSQYQIGIRGGAEKVSFDMDF